MDALRACDEFKAKATACYGAWFDRLLAGRFEQADCVQESDDYKQCILDAIERNKDQAKPTRPPTSRPPPTAPAP
ncbi:hypothetical protein H310_03134 [Aphanomyces invadans]|uniref:IMS import disulfide relay-system CHCH-CHCH-like Cx9C domain-containing protein n=1 Tax=Aphanomyces invadans TaxID=157072 RepID=A0A024ULK1_9STRA|nr:hypothetical protein H310_03134 [Aphanomyces invadans]ETW07055.1 hypothetical protein H310_03134 [Aphanomyces invadans]|eukprot:XP_008865130.1 hypothetical protein H310_03134 [Aphanomyces invadans]